MIRTRPRAPRREILALSLAIGAALVPFAANAQQIRTEGRNFRIAYEPGSATQNGYMDAQVEVTYFFGVCADQIAFLASYNPTAHMLVGNHRYWVDGRQVSVPPHIGAPEIARPTIRGTVRGPNTVRDINYVYASTGTPSCLTNDVGLGATSTFWPAGTTFERKLQIVSSFGFDYRGTLPPLRNAAVENHFRQIFAQERTDSLNRARAAEQQRLQARTDSLNRVRAAQAAAAAQASTAATTASTAGAGNASSTAGTTAGQRQPTADEREAAARDAAARDAAANAEAARVAAANAEERRRQQEAFEQQLASDVQAATVATMNLVGSIMDARRASAERKRARAAREAAAASARYAAYVAETKARFDAAPKQPTCTTADVRDNIALSFGVETRSVPLTSDLCRLGGGQSARLMGLTVPSDGPIYITATSAPLTNIMYLLEAGTHRALYSGYGGLSISHVEAGRYVLVVSSQLPGEVGTVEVKARRAWVSDAQGSVGFAFNAAQPINGFVGTNETSSSFMDLRFALQHRRRLPYLFVNMMFATDVEATESMVDVGLRQNFGPLNATIQPWIEGSLGWREIYVLQEPFHTISPAIGAGINYRFSRGYGLSLSATQLTGKAKNTDDIWTSTPPKVPLDRTIFRVGLLIY